MAGPRQSGNGSSRRSMVDVIAEEGDARPAVGRLGPSPGPGGQPGVAREDADRTSRGGGILELVSTERLPRAAKSLGRIKRFHGLAVRASMRLDAYQE